jgi:hypothetical protein
MKLHSNLKIALFSMIFSHQVFAAVEPTGIDCIENGNNSTAWKVHRQDNRSKKLSIYKNISEYDRMTCGSRWGCDVHVYSELSFEEDIKLVLRIENVNLTYQGKRNTLRIDLTSKTPYDRYKALLSYPAKNEIGEWYIVNRNLTCSLH